MEWPKGSAKRKRDNEKETGVHTVVPLGGCQNYGSRSGIPDVLGAAKL